MSNHVIVVLDHSGSMSEGFSGQRPPQGTRGELATQSTKIEEAKAQLLSWLATSTYSRVTLIPFSSGADRPTEFELPSQLGRISAFLERIDAGGGTNLAEALRIAILEIGQNQPADWFVRYLIVTDGLSSTPDEDHLIVEHLPRDQGIDAIFIDPTPEGEAHIRTLCVRGRFTPVFGAHQFRAALDERASEHRVRGDLRQQLAQSLHRVASLAERVQEVVHATAERGEIAIQARREAEPLLGRLAIAAEREAVLREQIANPDFPEGRLREQLWQLSALLIAAEDFVRRYSGLGGGFRVSLTTPRRLSKGFSGLFLVQVFSPRAQRSTRKRIRTVFGDSEIKETTAESTVLEGQAIDVALLSPALEFSPSVRKVFGGQILHALFWGAAKDICRPGSQSGLLAIRDAATGHELDSLPFTIEVVDYAFDHVSRPFLGRIASATAGLGALAGFVLTFFEKVDKGFGLASGTAASVLAIFFLHHVSRLYRSPVITTPSSVNGV